MTKCETVVLKLFITMPMRILLLQGVEKYNSKVYRNIDFQRSKGGFTFPEKNHNFTYVRSWMFLMTKCDNTIIKAVCNYKNKVYYTGTTKCN